MRPPRLHKRKVLREKDQNRTLAQLTFDYLGTFFPSVIIYRSFVGFSQLFVATLKQVFFFYFTFIFITLSNMLHPLSLYRNESSSGERTLYKTLLLIRIFRKTVRQEQIQDTKSTRKRTSVFTTELNERVHESKQCIPSLFTYIELKVPPGSFFGKIVFTSRTTRANPVLKSSISN